MRSILMSVLLCALLPTAHAQLSEAEQQTFEDAFERIIAHALTEEHTWQLLQELCTVAPRRLSGSPAAAAAVEWGRKTMEELGLENVRLEPCLVPHWERGPRSELRLLAPEQATGEELPLLALGGSVATPEGGIQAEVLEVHDFDELAARADEVPGRIVFFNRPMDPTELNTMRAYGGAVNQRTQGAIEAARLGAVAVVVRSMTTRLDDVPHTGGMRYADDVPRIPSAAVSTLAAERISALLQKGPVRLHLLLSCEWHEDAPSFNVVGELVGRELPDEIVVVSGHLDAWDVGQGAHDDGAGCCHALEAVRLLQELDLRPRRTLRVVLYMNEENGLRGGRAYAAAHEDALEKHVLALESDRGGFTPRGFTSNANPEALEILQSVANLLVETGAGTVFPGGGGADISPLGPSGVVLVGYLPDGQRYFDYHHAANDTLDKVHPRELELGTASIAALVYAVAEMEQPLPRNPVED